MGKRNISRFPTALFQEGEKSREKGVFAKKTLGSRERGTVSWNRFLILIGVGMTFLVMAFVMAPRLEGDCGSFRYILYGGLFFAGFVYLIMFYFWEIKPSYEKRSPLALVGYLLFYLLLSLLIGKS